jgi:hypothetical protein
MKGLIFFILFTIVWLAIGCQDKNPTSLSTQKHEENITLSNYKTVNFDSTIVLIYQRSIGNETYDGLFLDSGFIDLYEHGSCYLNDVTAFLAQNKFSGEEKRIAVCSMQRLDLTEYIKLAKVVVGLYHRHEVDEDVLSWVVNPDFSTKKILIRNYKNKEVVDLLSKLKNEKSISANLKEAIDNILTGRLMEFLEESGDLTGCFLCLHPHISF